MRGKILVIEDEMAINDLISMNLEVTGYEVVSCLDGLEAEETLKKEADFVWPWWISCFRERMALRFCRS